MALQSYMPMKGLGLIESAVSRLFDMFEHLGIVCVFLHHVLAALLKFFSIALEQLETDNIWMSLRIRWIDSIIVRTVTEVL